MNLRQSWQKGQMPMNKTRVHSTFPRSIRKTVGNIVSHIRLNAVWNKKTNGKPFVVKRRNWFGRHITPVANLFFRAAHVPISFFGATRDWQEYEVKTFKMLNPEFEAEPIGQYAVREQKLPGQSLWIHLRRGTLTLPMMKAAAREFHRAHSMISEVYHDRWSHGDGAMRNVIYDPDTDRARLIDFELVHDRDLSAEARHADDLSAFLLELVSFVQTRHWLRYALGFLRTYGDTAVIPELKKRLTPQGGVSNLWWRVRTNFVDGGKVKRRLKQLCVALDHLAGVEDGTSRGAGWRRRVQNRLPSIHCQTNKAGMPIASSRTRRIMATANAVSGPIPSAVPTTK
jgi:hypothetical protein